MIARGFRSPADIHNAAISDIVDWLFVFGIIGVCALSALNMPSMWWTGPDHHPPYERVMP